MGSLLRDQWGSFCTVCIFNSLFMAGPLTQTGFDGKQKRSVIFTKVEHRKGNFGRQLWKYGYEMAQRLSIIRLFVYYMYILCRNYSPTL